MLSSEESSTQSSSTGCTRHRFVFSNTSSDETVKNVQHRALLFYFGHVLRNCFLSCCCCRTLPLQVDPEYGDPSAFVFSQFMPCNVISRPRRGTSKYICMAYSIPYYSSSVFKVNARTRNTGKQSLIFLISTSERDYPSLRFVPLV